MPNANIVLASECQPNTDADVAAFNAHEAAIKPHWDRAFLAIHVPTEYKVGDIVWLYDHYNTGRVTGGSLLSPNAWCVETSDADGKVYQFEYEAEWLRPADREWVFVWPGDTSA